MKHLAACLMTTMSVPFATAAGKTAKIDWKVCQKELQEYCTSSADDVEKHECLEEAPKGKLSKACADHNAKVEKQIGHRHEEGHSH